MASRALAASSGVRTLPSAESRSRTSSRRCRGTCGAGGSMKRSYMSYRPSRPISRASRNPAVVRRPVLAPLRSISALVASVVPWMRAATLAASRPASWSRVSTPCSTAWAGSLGVVRSLPTRTAPVTSSTSTRSVKVPPMSTPMREPPDRVALLEGKCTGSQRCRHLRDIYSCTRPSVARRDDRVPRRGHRDHVVVVSRYGARDAHGSQESAVGEERDSTFAEDELVAVEGRHVAGEELACGEPCLEVL